MRFFSFVKSGYSFIPVEIQVSLLPGLPEVIFTGLVDTAIKESSIRLKSAFRKMGFKWPQKQQIIINLSPAYIKKSSPGMDLALASAILWRTGQMDFSRYNNSSLYFYGEVDLQGLVLTPQDWKSLAAHGKDLIIGSLDEINYKQDIFSVNHLKELPVAKKILVEDWTKKLQAPDIPDISFSKKAADLLKIAATGEHPWLLCGAAGSGKTTLAEHLYYLLSAPTKKTFEELELIFHTQYKWRTFINPHHSTTALSMIGGGSSLFPGEISKAHGGLLCLDEYLEFHPKVQESLREPLEKGEIRIVRNGKCNVFPAKFLLVATSNLCPCGDYEPNRPIQCAYSLKRCQSHLDRLSGPMLDRFDLLTFSKDWQGAHQVTLKSLHVDVQKAQNFIYKNRQQVIPNSKLELKDLTSMLDKNIESLIPQNSSHRRKRALLRVARTLSDLKQEPDISVSSLNQAMLFTVKNFFFLKNRILSQ